MRRLMEEFDAFDCDNTTYHVQHYKSVITTGSKDSPKAILLGNSSYFLSNGDSIKMISEKEFELLSPQIRIFRR